MAGIIFKVDMRRGKILERLKQDNAVSVAKLVSELGVSPVTIRSDLSALEKEGYLIRVQGGAVSRCPMREDLANETNDDPVLAEKLAIAQEVSKQIQDGDTVFINSGSTMECVAKAFRSHKNLNIVTNALAVAMELGDIPTFRVILLGGKVNALYGFTCGSDAQEQLEHYQADWAILALDGISAKGGMTTYHAEESNINRMMISQAKRTLVAAEHMKIGKAGFFRFGETLAGTWLITDAEAESQAVLELEQRGVTVICVET